MLMSSAHAQGHCQRAGGADDQIVLVGHAHYRVDETRRQARLQVARRPWIVTPVEQLKYGLQGVIAVGLTTCNVQK